MPATAREHGTVTTLINIAGIIGSMPGAADETEEVRMTTRSAALSYANVGIRVNNICPGLIMTDMAIEEGEEDNAALIALTPMGRRADPAEVSGAAVLLASDEYSYVTGTEIAVNGKYLAQ